LAVAAQNLVTAEGVWHCREADIAPGGQTHLDELSERMDWLEQQPFGKRLAPIIDREADSAAHIRQWSEHGQHWLARVKAASTICFDGQSMRVEEVAKRLKFHETRQVKCKGKSATQWVASAPLALRLVVSRLHDAQGQMISEWFLLCNLHESVDDAKIALWHY
jgi:hypothetical protein